MKLSREAAYQLLLSSPFDTMEANSYDPDQYRVNCPYCKGTLKPDGEIRGEDTDHKLYVNIFKQAIFCQRCGTTGGLDKLFREKMGLSEDDLKRLSDNTASFLFQTRSFEELVLDEIIPPYVPKDPIMGLPDEFELLNESTEDPYELLVFDYLFRRGVDTKTIRGHKIGFCRTGRYKDRLIIPCFEDGKLVYFTNRLCLYNGEELTRDKEILVNTLGIQKTLNPSKKLGMIGKSEVVFNIDNARKAKYIIVTEGPFDALNVGSNAVAILGSVISNRQVSLIGSSDVSGFIVMLDADAFSKAVEVAKVLSTYRDTWLVQMNPEDKDPGSISKEKINNYITDAFYFNEYELRMMGLI
jgi:hypothetical protein